MSEKITRLKQVYRQELRVIEDEAKVRMTLLAYIRDGIVNGLGSSINNMTEAELKATEKLVTFANQKLRELAGEGIAGSFGEISKYKNVFENVDLFFQSYPFIQAKFNDALLQNLEDNSKVMQAVLAYRAITELKHTKEQIADFTPLVR